MENVLNVLIIVNIAKWIKKLKYVWNVKKDIFLIFKESVFAVILKIVSNAIIIMDNWIP